MLKRIAALWYWHKALQAVHHDDSEQVLHWIARMEAVQPRLRAVESALKGMQLIDLRRFDDAEQALTEALAAINRPLTDNKRYIQIVCLLWREEAFNDLLLANALWAEAMALDCHKSLRYLLPLRQPRAFRLY